MPICSSENIVSMLMSAALISKHTNTFKTNKKYWHNKTYLIKLNPIKLKLNDITWSNLKVSIDEVG